MQSPAQSHAMRPTYYDAPPFNWETGTELALSGQEAAVLLRQAQELTGTTFVRFDIQTRQRSVGANYEKVLGFPLPRCLEEMLGRVHPDDRDSFLAADTRVFAVLGRHAWCFRVQTPAGETRWIEATAETTGDAVGKPLRVLLTCRNVSASRLGAFDPARSLDELRRVQSAAKVGVWETNLVTGKEIWSPEAWELVEPGGQGEATSERWLAAVHPDDRERALEGYCLALETGQYDDEFRIVHPNGCVRWHRAIATVEYDAAGKPRIMRGVVVDVSERRQAKDTLARLAMIIEATPDFVGWCDLDGRAVYLNPAGRTMLGVSPAEPVQGMAIVDYIAPIDRERLTVAMQAAIDTGMWCGELGLLARDGRHIPVSGVILLHRDAAGRPLYLSSIQRDISKDKAAEQALRDADRRKDEFLATLGHELRNSLTPLQSAGDVLRQLAAGDDRLAMVRRIVEQQTSHLTRLVDDLLDVSRLATGKLTLQKAPVSLDEVVKAACEMCRSEIAARGHVLELALPSDRRPLRVDGDLFRLTQVLANLIGNAAKYTPDGGRIRLGLRQDDTFAALAVEDNGVGIAADFLPKVFDAFAQAAEQRQRAAGGLGLGLMLVRQIVQLHGGTVTATSGGPGKGARFEVRLPLLAASAGVGGTDRPAPAALSMKGVGVRVLVVDDYAAIRDSMELMLSLRGFQVETAESGQAALASLDHFKPDAVLMDMRMPGMSGLELIRAVRARPDGAGLRIIAMTGNGTDAERKVALQAGFDEHVIKPVGIDRLTELLASGPPGVRAVA